MTDRKIELKTSKQKGEVKTRMILPGKKSNLNVVCLDSPENDLLGHIEMVKDMLQFYFKNQSKNK